MPSDYDALLDAQPAQTKSDYDQLLDQKSTQPQPQSGGVLSGIGAGISRLIPKSLGEIVGFVKGSLIPESSATHDVLQAGRMIGDVAGGASLTEAAQKEAPEVIQQGAALRGEYGKREQVASLFGLGTQIGMLAAPFIHGTIPTLRETAFGKAPTETPLSEAAVAQEAAKKSAWEDLQREAENARKGVVGSVRVQPKGTEAAPTTESPESQVAKANVEAAPVTSQAPVESFPSISRSAEEERRTAPSGTPKVREAISLDELRLIREKNDLQLQNDLSRRATGSTHPAVDERIVQIDEELTNIANRELQQQGGGEVRATQEGQIQEGVQPERPRDDARGTPAEAGGGGGVRSTAEVVPQTQVTPEPGAVSGTESPPASAPQVHPTADTASTEPAKTGVANRYLEDVYGDSAPVATTGKGPKAWKNIGQGRLDNFQKTGSVSDDPYAVLTNLRSGKVPISQVPSDVSLLRAEHQRLLEDARKSEGTPQYAEKSQAALDMANAIKPVAHGPASDVFRSLKEHDPPRYDNLTDFDQALRERVGRESTPEEKSQFQRIVNDVKRTRTAADSEVESAQRKVKQYQSRSKLSFDDATKSIHDQLTELTKLCNL